MVKMVKIYAYFTTIKKKKNNRRGENIFIGLYRYKISLERYLKNAEQLAPTGREYGWLEDLEGRQFYTVYPFLLKC